MTGAGNSDRVRGSASTLLSFASARAPYHATGCILSLLVMTLYLGTSACAISESSQSSLNSDGSRVTIQLDQSVHFSSPDGAPVLVPADEYLVERTADAQLRLLTHHGGSPLILMADEGTHDLEVSVPFPLILALHDDARDVVLLMPDGTALDASGSLSGVRTRDIVRQQRRYQLNSITGQVQFGEGATGQRLPAGQSSVSSTYRVGAGAPGNSTGPSSGDSEVSMIQLQSVVSNRQTLQALTAAIAAARSEHFRLEYDTDRPGGDYAQQTVLTPEACRAACSANGNCHAFTFVKPPTGLASGRCYLKRTVPPPVGDRCCIAAKRKSAEQELADNVR